MIDFTKYWEKAFRTTQYIAIDKDGTVIEFEIEPRHDHEEWLNGGAFLKAGNECLAGIDWTKCISTRAEYGSDKAFKMPSDIEVFYEDKKDPGAHYRHEFKGVKLDPFRIAYAYMMKSFAMMTILKKCLCAGNRGHKDYKTDLLDIISAAQREIEILEEDNEQ